MMLISFFPHTSEIAGDLQVPVEPTVAHYLGMSTGIVAYVRAQLVYQLDGPETRSRYVTVHMRSQMNHRNISDRSF